MALLIYFICFVSENVQEQLRDNICQELIFCDYDLMDETAASLVLSVCVKHSAFIKLSFEISLLNQSMLLMSSFYFQSVPLYF